MRILVCILFSILFCISSFALDKQVVVEPSIVQVGGVCSGVIVKQNLVVTAGHCIRNKSAQILVEFYDHAIAFGLVVHAASPEDFGTPQDYALIRVKTGDLASLVLTPVSPTVYLEECAQIGYTLEQRAQFFSPCLFIREFEGDVHVIAKVLPGDSGSPLLNENKEIFAIVHSSYWPLGLQLTLAVPARNVLRTISEKNL